jgi:hypothetical protein
LRSSEDTDYSTNYVLTKEKKAIEDKIKSITNMNVAELTKHMKAPLQDDEAAVILSSGF